jgi:hypothetical protein
MSDIVMRGSTRHTVEYVKYPRLDVTSNPYRKKPKYLEKYQPNPTAQIGPDKNTELRSSTAIAAERKYTVSKIVQYRYHKP